VLVYGYLVLSFLLSLQLLISTIITTRIHGASVVVIVVVVWMGDDAKAQTQGILLLTAIAKSFDPMHFSFSMTAWWAEEEEEDTCSSRRSSTLFGLPVFFLPILVGREKTEV